MTNEEIAGVLTNLSEALADVTKEVGMLLKSQNVDCEFRPQLVRDADALLAKAVGIHQLLLKSSNTQAKRSEDQ